jgi:hypothetical protein
VFLSSQERFSADEVVPERSSPEFLVDAFGSFSPQAFLALERVRLEDVATEFDLPVLVVQLDRFLGRGFTWVPKGTKQPGAFAFAASMLDAAKAPPNAGMFSAHLAACLEVDKHRAVSEQLPWFDLHVRRNPDRRLKFRLPLEKPYKHRALREPTIKREDAAGGTHSQSSSARECSPTRNGPNAASHRRRLRSFIKHAIRICG